ncbi:hypothetical protein Naga_100547g4 [Nannochloropsis gaditana]|uniref:Uncharacterized protein n=1 Tax=Nannochloropsis gaditana TaxID=72520 RepID=W7TKN8_9STRA|nr:hypothetical protein Naga_100547g4 [Nannochloropsis gaditana]
MLNYKTWQSRWTGRFLASQAQKSKHKNRSCSWPFWVLSGRAPPSPDGPLMRDCPCAAAHATGERRRYTQVGFESQARLRIYSAKDEETIRHDTQRLFSLNFELCVELFPRV